MKKNKYSLIALDIDGTMVVKAPKVDLHTSRLVNTYDESSKGLNTKMYKCTKIGCMVDAGGKSNFIFFSKSHNFF